MTLLGEDKITEMFGTPQEMRVSLEHFERDVLFLWNNIATWRELYLDKWIAIYQQEVVAAGESTADVLEKVRGRGVRPGDTVIQAIRASYSDVVPSSFPSYG